jgi:hypothetical protein
MPWVPHSSWCIGLTLGGAKRGYPARAESGLFFLLALANDAKFTLEGAIAKDSEFFVTSLSSALRMRLKDHSAI